nr:putative cyclic nucleotide-gated ion channel 7 [Tanacetum cinerariifolium]
MKRAGFNIEGSAKPGLPPRPTASKSIKLGMRRGSEGLINLGQSFKTGVARAVFSEDLKFRTAYIAPSSRVFGRGELVIDPAQIARRYMQRYFVVDLLSVLPLPQIVVWSVGWCGILSGLVCSCWPLLLLFVVGIEKFETYLQSLSVRLEEMRIKRRDSEQWMHHRLLPQELKERVRRYDQYKWVETRGVDEESLVQSLPKDLRRDIKRHLCLNLVKRVPLFANMDERLLDAICERLKPSLYTETTYVLREGDPVDEMLFIIRGRLESVF